jgi:hypothetical protein
MTKNIIKVGMKRINKKLEIIIKKIKRIFSKCIKLGRKRMWIPGVPSGGDMVDGLGSRILTSIKNIMHVIEKRFFIKRKFITERR